MIHVLAWIAWLAAVAVAISPTRNPLHLALVLLCIALVESATNARRRAEAETAAHTLSRAALLRAAALLPLLSALLNMLNVRAGATVLFRLPGWLPLIGGPLTLEAAIFGALNGLALAGLLVAFASAQRALPVGELVRLIPRAFDTAGVVATIAITFVPVTLRQARLIRDAQAIRGHQLRGLRDWLPLLMPLLIGGLERAMNLAEAMTARGFAAAPYGPRESRARMAIVAGLVALLAGWVLDLAWGQATAGRTAMLGGGGLLIGALWLAGGRSPRTRYRVQRWSARDTAIVIGAAVVIAAYLVPLPGIDRAASGYYPYPRLSLPPFDPALGFATLGLAWPALALALEES